MHILFHSCLWKSKRNSPCEQGHEDEGLVWNRYIRTHGRSWQTLPKALPVAATEAARLRATARERELKPHLTSCEDRCGPGVRRLVGTGSR